MSIYYILFCKSLDASIGISNDIKMVNKYIDQFDINKYDITILKKSFTNDLDESDELSILELKYLSNNIVLTNLEIQYYNEYLKKLYEDMKTTISSLIVYSNIGLLTNDEKQRLQNMAKFLYGNRMMSYEEFLDSLDRDILFSKIIINPIFMQQTLYDHLDLKQQWDSLKETF